MQSPDVPDALAACKDYGLDFDLMKTSFFLSRETIVPSLHPAMARWRELLLLAGQISVEQLWLIA